MPLSNIAQRILTVAKEWAAAHEATEDALYSWTNGDRGRHLCDNYNDEAWFLQNYNHARDGNHMGGPGIYLSTSMTDTAEYGNEVGGCLIQVSVPDRIPWINALAPACMHTLRTGNPAVTAQHIYLHDAQANERVHRPPILFGYQGNWYCLKTTKGVNFRYFDGRGKTVQELTTAYTTLKNSRYRNAAATFYNQLRDSERNQIPQ